MAGRVAISTPTGPHIIPVNYSVVDDAIVVRTSPYSLLGTYGRDTTFAFEIDGFDRERERGWSVQARGRAEAVTDHAELERIPRSRTPARGPAEPGRCSCGCAGRADGRPIGGLGLCTTAGDPRPERSDGTVSG